MISRASFLTPTSLIGAIALTACEAPSDRSQAPGTPETLYTVETIASGLSYPWDIAFIPNGDILVTERTGAVRVIREGQLLEATVSGLPEVYFAGQGGLLEIEASPDFERNNHVFLTYSAGDADASTTYLARGVYVDGALSDLDILFEAYPDRSSTSHYGGRMAFLPDDTLLLTLGDGFEYREQAQVLDNHLGTLVRLNLDGSIPADNPFAGEDGPLAHIYSYGHRNVQGIAYDPVRQIIWEHEHGPRGGDELNRIEVGANYGWPIVTAGLDYNGARISPFSDHEAQGFTAPVLGWSPSIAPSGLTVYTADLFADWQGDLFITALAGAALHHIALNEDGHVIGETRILLDGRPRLRHVVTGPDGALWVLTDSEDGAVLRLTPSVD